MHRASLNHTFRLVWNEFENAFVATAESIGGLRKSSCNGTSAKNHHTCIYWRNADRKGL